MTEVWLGIIALSTLVMAAIQVAAVVAATRAARRVERLADRVEHEIAPLVAGANEVMQNALKASALAVTQVERADELLTRVTSRVDDTFSLVQAAIVAPAREGRAVVAGVRAAIRAFRELRSARARRTRLEDEDALFIG